MRKIKTFLREIKNNVLLNRVINILCLILIALSSIKVIHAMYYVVYATFTNRILSITDLEKVLSAIFPMHAALLMVPIYLMAFAILNKNIKLWHWGISIIGGFIIPSYELFDMYIHPILFKTHIFDLFMRPGQTVLNPQYTKLLFFCLMMIILLVINLFKKKRSVDRIFVLLIACAVMTTTFIFHVAIPMGYFKYAKYQLDINLSEQMHYIPQEKICENKNCFVLDNNLHLVSKTPNSDVELLKTYRYFLEGGSQYLSRSDIDTVYTSPLGNFKGQRFDYIISAIQKKKNGYFIIMDEKVAQKYSRNSEIWFAFLSAVAHFTWIFGGLGLLFLHKKRFFRKQTPKMKV